MKLPYDVSYHPPFPAVSIRIHNEPRGLRTEFLNGLTDTGADGSLVPIEHLRAIRAPAVMDKRIKSHWGELRAVQLFVVDLEIANIRLPAVLVVGDEQGNEIIIGRDVLNKLRLLLDGPANILEIK
ncbi:MAG: hypothetical protein HZC40_18675 [Chloroflexi bacterium]|nr:hypothetical protein [Chloroflexota bacterium]